MPYYSYTSEKGDTIERFFSVDDHPETIVHEDVFYDRDVAADFRDRKPVAASWPRWSDAAGVGVDQVKEAYDESVAAGCPVEYCKETGRAKFESLSHQRRALKAMGLRDRSAFYD